MHIGIFPGSLSEWDLNQSLLVNWLRFYYHRVYSLPDNEAPPDDLVKYDLLLDDWLEEKDDREERERNKKTGHESFKMY